MTNPMGPLPRWLAPIAAPASVAYGVLSDAVLERRASRATSLPRPTLSVGNISAGGSGKSPVVRWIAAHLVGAGCRPLIVTRGYRRERGGVGDETLEHREALPGVSVIEGVDRAAAVEGFLAQGGVCDCIILDDGFQRRDVARALDVVVVRASDLGGRRLPLGWLREPPRALHRASLITCWEEESGEVGLGLQRLGLAKEPVVFSREWTGFRVSRGGIEETWPLCSGTGLRADIWLGIGRPEGFLEMAACVGVPIGSVVRLRDHTRYTADWVERRCARLIQSSVHEVLTSEKDWVKVRSAAASSRSAAGVSFVRPMLGVALARPRPVPRALATFTAEVLETRG